MTRWGTRKKKSRWRLFKQWGKHVQTRVKQERINKCWFKPRFKQLVCPTWSSFSTFFPPKGCPSRALVLRQWGPQYQATQADLGGGGHGKVNSELQWYRASNGSGQEGFGRADQLLLSLRPKQSSDCANPYGCVLFWWYPFGIG